MGGGGGAGARGGSAIQRTKDSLQIFITGFFDDRFRKTVNAGKSKNNVSKSKICQNKNFLGVSVA